MNERPIVVLAAGRAQLPLIERANELGFQSWAFDQDAQAPGASAATRFAAVSARDAAAILSRLRPWAAEDEPAGIVSGSSAPDALLAASLIGASLGLLTTSHASIKRVLDRGSQRTALMAANVPVPPAAIVLGVEDAVSSVERLGRAVLKPAAGTSGSAGVAFVQPGPDLELRARAAEAAGDGRIVVEEILEGDEYSIDALAIEGKARVLSITRKETDTNPPLPLSFSTVSPTIEEKTRTSLFLELVDMVVQALDLKHMAFNLDVICTANGPIVIEVGCSLDAKVDRLLHFAGRDVYGALCQVAVGEVPKEWKPLGEGFSSRFLYSARLLELSQAEMQAAEALAAEKGAKLEWQVEPGAEIRPARSLGDTLGWLLCKGKTGEEAQELGESLARELAVKLSLGRDGD